LNRRYRWLGRAVIFIAAATSIVTTAIATSAPSADGNMPDRVIAVPLCIACKQPIEVGATLCPKCASYQRRWRNEIKYWSGIAGLVTLIATGLAFAGNNALLLYDRLFPPDLVVSEFNSFGKVALWNGSKQNAWLTHLQVHSEKPFFEVEWPLYTMIKANSPFVRDMVKESAESILGSNKEIFGVQPGDYAVEPDETTIKNFERSDTDIAKRFVPAFLSKNGTDFRQIEENYAKKYSFGCTASLEYVYTSSISVFTSRNLSKVLAFPCVGMIRKRP
jgi:hypothetical protein